MRTAIYCRVSTDDQEKEGTSLHTQRDACLAYCQTKGYQVIRQFSETFSGLTLDRPKLADLRNLVRVNDLDIIVVYCLDRLSRNATHGVVLRDELDRQHVRLESVTEDIDHSPLGEAITYLRGTFAQIEAEKIKERTMRGKMARLKEGQLPHGTGKGIYGYDWNKDIKRRTVNELEAKVVLKLFTMALEGQSVNKMAVELNQAGIKSKSGSMWHPLTIRRIVTNETYTGKTYSGKTKRTGKTKVTSRPREDWFFLPDVTPPIIDEQMFGRAQEAIFEAKKNRPIKIHSPYLLTGFLKCAKCGMPVGGTTLNGKYRYYQCRGARPTATRTRICDAGYIKAPQLDKAIWFRLHAMLSSPLGQLSLGMNAPKANDVVPMLDKQIAQLRKKLKAHPAKERSLYDLLSHEAVTKEYVLDAVAKLKQDQSSGERQLASLLASRKDASKAQRTTLKLSERSEELRTHILNPNNPAMYTGLQENRAFFEQLNLHVVADPNNFQLKFQLGANILVSVDPTDATAMKKSIGANKTLDVHEALREFEERHPATFADAICDVDTCLPEDTDFGKAVNQMKRDLVTIERTSGCLPFHAYICAAPMSYLA